MKRDNSQPVESIRFLSLLCRQFRTFRFLTMSFIDNPQTLDEALAGRQTGLRNGGLVVLNIILSIVQLSSYATGYDGSMMSKFLTANSVYSRHVLP